MEHSVTIRTRGILGEFSETISTYGLGDALSPTVRLPILAFCSRCGAKEPSHKVKGLGRAKAVGSSNKVTNCPICGHALFHSNKYTLLANEGDF